MSTSEKARLRSRLKRKITTLSNKGKDHAFHEKIHYEGYEIALKFYKSIEEDIRQFRSIVGSDNDEFLEISEAIAYLGSGILRGATARTRVLINAPDFRKNQHLLLAEKDKVEKCYQLSRVFSQMYMQDEQVIATVTEVENIHRELYYKLNKKTGCYIATAVYGSSNSKEVLLFKQYRDDILANSLIGRVFISFYYLISPTISKYLQGREIINSFIKNKILNPCYRKLSSKI